MTNLTKAFIIINYLKHILRVYSCNITWTAEADQGGLLNYIFLQGFFFFLMNIGLCSAGYSHIKPAEASSTLSTRRQIGADLVRSAKGETVSQQWTLTQREVKRIGWREHRAAWRWWVSRCAGTDGTLNGGTGCAGQAGATWLVETDEDWVLGTLVVVASSSPNGFFPEHTVVIMQFLN